MKIVFLARYLPAEGSTTHMYSIAERLVERGHKMYIFSRGAGEDQSAIKLFEKTKLNGVSFVKIPFPLNIKYNLLGKISQLLSYIFATPYALYKLLKIKPDVIHAHYPVTTYLASIYRLITGKKYIVTHHTMGIPQHILNRKADYAIAISRELQNYLVSSYNYKETDVKLIFNGVSKQKFSRDRDSSLISKESFNISSDKLILGFIGSVSYQKGIDVLINALTHCKELKIHLLLLGNGKISWAQQLIDENEITDMVTLIPFRDPIGFYAAIDVLILPSRREGFPLVPIEAMMMNTPVIRSNVEGAHDQIIEGINGYIFESENHLQLAKIIEKIALNPEVLVYLGENAHKHAIKNFSEDIMIDKLLDVYSLTE